MNPYGSHWPSLRLAILMRDHWTCKTCKTPLQTETRRRQDFATVDHILPKIEGGSDHPDNLRAMCLGCNSRLGQATKVARARNRQKTSVLNSSRDW